MHHSETGRQSQCTELAYTRLEDLELTNDPFSEQNASFSSCAFVPYTIP